MIFELPIVILIISISFHFFRKKKKELRSYGPLISKFGISFDTEVQYLPSIHQIVSLYSGNDIISTLYCIVSLTKDFCISQVLLTPQPSKIVITGFLKNFLRPNFYIFKSLIKFKHAGLIYSKKYLLSNNDNYKLYGVINEKILQFVSKHDFDIFYCSYVPQGIDSRIFRSQFYLRGKVNLLNSEEFVVDLLKILEEKIEDTDKRVKDIKMKHLLEYEKYKEEESKGFIQKLKKEFDKKKKPFILKTKKKRSA